MTRDKEKKFAKDQLLLEAARLGQVNQLEIILKEFQHKSKKRSNPLASLRKASGPNNIRDPVTGFTCLHHAALNGHSQCVQLILDSGCKVNAVDYKGSSALHLAARAGHVQVVKELIEHCARSTNCDNNSSRGQQQVSPSKTTTAPDYQELDVNLCNNDNQTPLSLAAQFGHNQVVAELLVRSANVHLRNNQLESPLDLACLNGRLETVRLLLNFAPELIDELKRSHSIDTTTSPICMQPLHSATTRAPQSNTSPTISNNHKHHSRRPSGSGWSSLLRTSKSRAGGETWSSSSPPPPTDSGSSLLICDNGVLASPNRRATLTGSSLASGGAGQWSNSKNLSLDCADLQQQQAAGRRLLDHSPLHYAVRRGHLQVVDLLLSSYEANVMQLTSLGGVLHEIAFTYCCSDRTTTTKAEDPSALLGLIFNCLNFRQQREASEDVLEKLLKLTNWQGKTVFDVLNDFNNTRAQEVRRAICEHSEQFKATAFARQHHHQSNTILTVKPLDQQQHQQAHSLFNNDQQINSFCTMKRLPKRKQQQQQTDQFFNANNNSNNLDQRHTTRAPLSTQTIDRRTRNSNNNSNTFSQDQLNYVDWNQHANRQQQQQPATAQQQQVPISMTRSVSNLMSRTAQQQPSQANNSQLFFDGRGQAIDVAGNANQQQHPLVRSQTDCSHLMGKFFGDMSYATNSGPDQANSIGFQNHEGAAVANRENMASHLQHSATIDRKAINRHYHVYDHEFYPPRLLHNPLASSLDQRNNKLTMNGQMFRQPHHQAAVAVVPPLNRSESTEASFTSPNRQRRHQQQQVTRVASFNRPANQMNTSNSIQSTSGHHHHHQQQQSLSSNSRLSLNIDCQPNAQLVQSNSVDSQHQQRQMDRFVGRHASRRSTNASQGETGFEEDLTGSQYLANQQSNQSFYCHPSDSNHLFETTRKALVRDFDQMIGRELLNRDHGQTMSSSEQLIGSSSSSSSLIQQHQPKRSILTGVSLDMDTRGERLIVSGTRITLPSPSAREARLSSISGQESVSSSANKLRAQSQGTQTSPTTPSQRSSRSSKSSSIVVGQSTKQQPFDSRPTSSASAASSSSSSVIYDLPSTADNANELSTSSRASVNLHQISSVLMTPQQQQQQTLLGSSSSKQAPQQHRVINSITRPPQEKPPPPPPMGTNQALNCPPPSEMNNNLAASQLRVTVPTGESGATSFASADPQSHSPAPSSTESCQNNFGSITSRSSSNSTRKNNMPARPTARTVAGNDRARQQAATSHQLILAIQSNGDADSGVCTSNSPSSMSHDSTERQSSNEQQSSSCSLESTRVEHQQQTIDFHPTAGAPPSPQTAQSSIEEALLPLEIVVTHEVANQTNFVNSLLELEEDAEHDDDDDYESARKMKSTGLESCSLDAIVGWLRGEQASNAAASKPRRSDHRKSKNHGDYENCLALQRQLESERCQSIDDLFMNSRRTTSAECEPQLATSTSPIFCSSCGSSSRDTRDEDAHPLAAASESLSDYETSERNVEQTCDTNNLASQSQLVRGKCKKEVLLKVVVDENNDLESSGDEVFYIEPSELKKISSSKGSRSQRNNMETLTDEELCASVDRKSGLIRFTLRKRRAESRDLCDNDLSAGEDSRMTSSCPADEQQQQVKQTSQFGSKKTKLNIEQNDVEENAAGTNSDVVVDETLPSETTLSLSQQFIEAAEMVDVSQTATTTSSSSSRDSIKSIVSLKQHQDGPAECDKRDCESQQSDGAENHQQQQNSELDSKLPTGDGENENKENVREEPEIEMGPIVPEANGTQDNVDDSNTTAEEQFDCNGATPRQPQEKQVEVISNSTTVVNETEPARASDCSPTATTTTPAAFKPIAAARKSQRFNQLDKPRILAINSDASTPNFVAGDDGKPKTTSKVSDIRQRLEQSTAQSQQQKQQPIKRAIRWPPPTQPQSQTKPTPATVGDSAANVAKKDELRDSALATNENVKPSELADNLAAFGRVSANRLSFQRLIEEKNKTITPNGPTKQPINSSLNRPKPAPPVKPANILLSNKFNAFDANSGRV